MRRISTGVQGRPILGKYFSVDNVLSTLETNTDIRLKPSGSGKVVADSDLRISSGNSLEIVSDSSSNSVNLVAPSGMSSDLTLTLPDNSGSAGDVLTIDGSGNLSFTDLTIEVANQTADTANYFPLLSTSNSGSISDVTVSSSKLSFQPSSGRLTTDQINIASSTSSTSTTTGALVTSGGAGFGGDINVGGNARLFSLGVDTNASGTAGEIRATNQITSFFSSDAKFKENVVDIPNALNVVLDIGGKLFDWTDEYITARGGEDGYFVQKQDFGVIAQDVERVFPRAVRTRDDDSLAVDYEKLCSLAFAAIVELKKEIDSIKGI